MPSSVKTSFSPNSTQLNFNFNFEAEIALFSDNTATHPTGKLVKWNKTSNTSLEEFKYLSSSVSTQFQLQLSLNSTQSQFNSTSAQTTELGTTQLKLVFSLNTQEQQGAGLRYYWDTNNNFKFSLSLWVLYY